MLEEVVVQDFQHKAMEVLVVVLMVQQAQTLEALTSAGAELELMQQEAQAL
jgi:hypothetical protein